MTTHEDVEMEANFSEDEYDAAIAENAYEDYINAGGKHRPIFLLWEELEL